MNTCNNDYTNILSICTQLWWNILKIIQAYYTAVYKSLSYTVLIYHATADWFDIDLGLKNMFMSLK